MQHTDGSFGATPPVRTAQFRPSATPHPLNHRIQGQCPAAPGGSLREHHFIARKLLDCFEAKPLMRVWNYHELEGAAPSGSPAGG